MALSAEEQAEVWGGVARLSLELFPPTENPVGFDQRIGPTWERPWLLGHWTGTRPRAAQCPRAERQHFGQGARPGPSAREPALPQLCGTCRNTESENPGF